MKNRVSGSRAFGVYYSGSVMGLVGKKKQVDSGTKPF